ncbi:receptor-like cytoplasmic kinase 176 [Papaver somniferum]|nr:receptor-like cytoplasmic kinase 176 [Papaver somniferum]XP_026417662.1 receptor-like cytoplasmic kinase 176 [Papaver somniferum]XP_026417663.1 receptor-like cytoplasmic kinase 176 [Papaver somniferum]
MGKCWHTEDSEEENGSGNCKTSGDQITCDVQIRVSPPSRPKQPPRKESKGLPDPISPKQVVPGSHSKISGFFSWKKGKRLQSTKSKLNSSSKTTCASIPPTARSEGGILQSSNLRSFSFSDLKTATRNFRPANVLGEGEFGSVFKGWIDENTFTATRPWTGIVIAVNRLNQEGLQGHREWLAEVDYFGKLYHPNLVKLIGYCAEDEHQLLVYEFIPRGSLENHLFKRRSGFQPLSWNLRMKIALGAAKGLAFLNSAETQVIYRDFQASNILLDSTYNTKLSDFGFASNDPTGDNSHLSTIRVIGTYDCVAPWHQATGHLTVSCNIYRFGVVFLEMLSGRKAIDKNRPAGEHNLIEWAKRSLSSKHSVLHIIDARIEGQYTQSGVLKAVNLAMQCLSVDPKCRPTMEEVVASLLGLQDSNGLPSEIPA